MWACRCVVLLFLNCNYVRLVVGACHTQDFVPYKWPCLRVRSSPPTRVAGTSSPHRRPPGRWGEPTRPAHPMVPESGRTPAVDNVQGTLPPGGRGAQRYSEDLVAQGHGSVGRNPSRGAKHPNPPGGGSVEGPRSDNSPDRLWAEMSQAPLRQVSSPRGASPCGKEMRESKRVVAGVPGNRRRRIPITASGGDPALIHCHVSPNALVPALVQPWP